MAYALEVPRKVQKRLARLPTNAQDRVDAAVRSLVQNLRPSGCRKLKDREEEWCIRVGDYRIVYEVDDDNKKVLVLEVWHRQRDYR